MKQPQHALEDDPRLTAYALGELEGAGLAAFEALLTRDEDARRAAGELRALARELERELRPADLELSAQAGARLLEEQRAGLQRALADQARRARLRRRRGWRLSAASAALALALAGGFAYRAASERAAREPFTYAIFGEPAQSRAEFRELGPLSGLSYLGSGDSIPSDAPGDSDILTENYASLRESGFLRALEAPLSTFSIDVDTASYANARRFLSAGKLPPADAVRVEEFVNYFPYDYPAADGSAPFSLSAEVASCPWASAHRLVRLGLQGRAPGRVPSAKNLVFLIDVSGSMQSADKLELLKSGLRLLVAELGPEDSVGIAVYAGAAGLVLEPTSDEQRVLAALDRLAAGGSTNGAAGIELAYELAQRHFLPSGVNRVILCTDGDFNVGPTSLGELESLIEARRATGVFLSVLGFGTGNLNDATMELLADRGNGNYHYIDGLAEARKVLVRDLHATLETIAKDVKIQVEFNPAEVAAYRLIGYENRALADRDFNDDTKDAGEIGAGHAVTAFYEIVPAGVPFDEGPALDELVYSDAPDPRAAGVRNGELMTVKVRFKEPLGELSRKLDFPVRISDRDWTQASDDYRFAAGVALFGMLLRESTQCGDATLGQALEIARGAAEPDPFGYRAELLGLVQRAIELRER